MPAQVQLFVRGLQCAQERNNAADVDDATCIVVQGAVVHIRLRWTLIGTLNLQKLQEASCGMEQLHRDNVSGLGGLISTKPSN